MTRDRNILVNFSLIWKNPKTECFHRNGLGTRISKSCAKVTKYLRIEEKGPSRGMNICKSDNALFF